MPQASATASRKRNTTGAPNNTLNNSRRASSTDIRSVLASYFQTKDSPTPAPSFGYHHWGCSSAIVAASAQQPRLLVGDPIALAENLKILKQYTKLLTQACHSTLETALTAHVQPLSRTPLSYPRALYWFQPLTAQFQPLDAADIERVVSLLELRAACNKESLPLAPAMQCELAIQLAQELPNFDRALTAFYLSSPLASSSAANDKDTITFPSTELDLHVAHSVLRLQGISHPDPNLTLWRSQGLVHVLSIAAQHMPTLADWFPSQSPLSCPDPAVDEDARALAHFLDRINTTPRDYVGAIECFIATLNGSSSQTAQAIATTVDRLAILMNVKSDAADEAGHDLASALASFPDFENDAAVQQPQEIWSSIKAALERSMPPSILRVDPDASCLKKRVKKNQMQTSGNNHYEAASRGTWCVCQPHPVKN